MSEPVSEACFGAEQTESGTAQLTALSGSLLGRRFVVKGTSHLGRSSSSSVVLCDAEVSRDHARIDATEDGFVVVDLGSRNGTFVNGQRVERALIRFGDKLRLGGTSFVFTKHDLLEEDRIQRHRLETLGRMCVGVVHDLNNALCVVTSSVAYLRNRRDSTDTSEVDECLADVQQASEQAALLAKQLVSFARGARAAPEPVDVPSLCTEVLQLARRTFPRNISVRSQLEPGLCVMAEPTQLHQILMNLCVNARDAILATNRSGSICVKATRSVARAGGGSAVEISVQDDGAGMDEATRERLFEPFFSTKEASAGYGMGLATVSDLVVQLGGHIGLTSEVGVGTTFSLELPEGPTRRTSVRRRPSGARTDCGKRRSSHGEHILVVDDDAAVRRSFSRILRQAGYSVSEAPEGESALTCLASSQSKVDLVLLDLDMPVMGGEQALGWIRQHHPRTPVVIVSGHVGTDVLARVRGRGAQAMIPKPCGQDELISYVARALDRGASQIFDETTLSGVG